MELSLDPDKLYPKYPKEARRVMREVLNEILADEKVIIQIPNWASINVPKQTYVIDANWFAVNRIDPPKQQENKIYITRKSNIKCPK